MCCPKQLVFHDETRDIKLTISLTSNSLDVCGEWSKEKFLTLLTNKLVNNSDFVDNNEEISFTLNHGIYSEIVISKLLKNGMAKDNIIKAMKCGLRNLSYDELRYFYEFNITPDMLWCKTLLLNDVDRELLQKLTDAGLSEDECVGVIVLGLVEQDQFVIFRLTTQGIAASKILNWQGAEVNVPEGVVVLLRKLGIDECTLQLVKKTGISREAMEMLYDLGFNETDLRSDPSIGDSIDPMNVIYKCELDIREEISKACGDARSDEASFESKSSVSRELPEAIKNQILEKKNYLRQTFMAPLTWVLKKTLQHNPSNPIHYIACQLFRWQYKNVTPAEMNQVLDFVIDETLKRDQKLLNQTDQEDCSAKRSDDVPCERCAKEMELHRIKKCSWKYVKKMMSVRSTCSFPDQCSACKLSKNINKY